jgi:nucleoside-diphosphate-sugar epimerase
LAPAGIRAADRRGTQWRCAYTANNLYGYGPVTGPISESTPLSATHPKLRLRADMWRDALARHEAGQIRATEVRASDYIEANSILTFTLGKPLLAGKRAYVPAPLDVPHSWTSITDVARTLVTLATDDRAWGQAWHVPTNPPLTIRDLAVRFTNVVGAPAPKLTSIPYPVVWTVGLFSPLVRELRTTRYQFYRPFILDSTATTGTFGIEPTSLDEVLRTTAASLSG